MSAKILPELLRQNADDQSLRFIEFYCLWVQSGCQGHYQGPTIDQCWRYLVRTEINQDGYLEPSVWVEEKRYAPSGPAQFWQFPKLFGSTKRHPSEWFALVLRGLADRVALMDMP
jgi:hypothetical protein